MPFWLAALALLSGLTLAGQDADGKHLIWLDPGPVENRDLLYGPGGKAGQPTPPFRFLHEDLAGSSAKVKVKDANGTILAVKFGSEAKPDVFASRLAWACGYIAQPEYLVSSGQIEGVHGLKRAASAVHDGKFTNGRFQLRRDEPKFLKENGWSWVNNPFRGTPQLNGLRMIMMLVSDWDNKDARDKDSDSNLAIFEEHTPDGPRYLYFVSDWGASMGKWGNIANRSKWDCKGYTEQTQDFVRGVQHDTVQWGYSGKRTGDQVRDIRISDVQWLMQFLGHLTDEQIRRGLAAAGASAEEIACFQPTIRTRIDRLSRIAAAGQQTAAR